MPQLICIDPAEQIIDVKFESGETILQATHRAGVDGIIAECGGGCSCATCQVILNADWDETLTFRALKRLICCPSQSIQHPIHALPAKWN